MNGLVSLDTSPFCVAKFPVQDQRVIVPEFLAGRVGEWLKPADCKSAAPCGLRRFESSPVHHFVAARALNQGSGKHGEFTKNFVATNRWGVPERYASGPVKAWVAQLVERVLGKDEVTGSIPVPGSRFRAGP